MEFLKIAGIVLLVAIVAISVGVTCIMLANEERNRDAIAVGLLIAVILNMGLVSASTVVYLGYQLFLFICRLAQ